MSPFEVVTGIKPSSSHAWLPSQSDSKLSKWREYFGIDKPQFERIRLQALKAIEKAQTGYLQRNEHKGRPYPFREGMKVLVRNQTAGKWFPKYQGPYRIVRLLSSSAAVLRNLETDREDTVHIDYIKPYHERSGSPRYVENDYDFPDDAEIIDEIPSGLKLQDEEDDHMLEIEKDNEQPVVESNEGDAEDPPVAIESGSQDPGPSSSVQAGPSTPRSPSRFSPNIPTVLRKARGMASDIAGQLKRRLRFSDAPDPMSDEPQTPRVEEPVKRRRQPKPPPPPSQILTRGQAQRLQQNLPRLASEIKPVQFHSGKVVTKAEAELLTKAQEKRDLAKKRREKLKQQARLRSQDGYDFSRAPTN